METVTCSLVPRLSWNANMYHTKSLVSFLRKPDVIKIGLKQKGNVLRVVQPTMLQRSVYMLFNARQLDTCSKLPATFSLFPVLCRGYTHAQLSSFYLLSTFTAFHVTKNTRLSTPAQLQCSRSGAWGPGNKAISHAQNPVWWLVLAMRHIQTHIHTLTCQRTRTSLLPGKYVHVGIVQL